MGVGGRRCLSTGAEQAGAKCCCGQQHRKVLEFSALSRFCFGLRRAGTEAKCHAAVSSGNAENLGSFLYQESLR